ncbi:wiskott-Aldrich syndrome protein [Clonorchis sinensis]|uniref:Wiskott-Aldrich syndrome protein n=1 Tax=Clonorchis sinensis TaxID=79923 RepID=H2KST7_CLOSI|nr:wiskott-Aldrich syndrome protein [Clonorchis sinensis]
MTQLSNAQSGSLDPQEISVFSYNASDPLHRGSLSALEGHQNARSELLTDAENATLHSLLGPNCRSRATAVVRLYLVKGAHQWVHKCYGVACYVRDKQERAHFIRVYDLDSQQELFGQELYLEMQYTRPLPRFHIMQSDAGPMGISFASVEEAKLFGDAVLEQIERRLARVQASQSAEPSPTAPVSTVASNNGIQPGIYELNRPIPTYQVSIPPQKKTKGKGKKAKLTSGDISAPSDFRHLQHVGYDKDTKKFDVSSEQNEMLREMLRMLGQEDCLNVPGEREFVVDFVRSFGWDEAKRQLSTAKREGGLAEAPSAARPAARRPPPPPPSHPPPPPVPGGFQRPAVAPPPPPPPPPPPCTSPANESVRPPPPVPSGGNIPPPPPVLSFETPAAPEPKIPSAPAAAKPVAALGPDLQSQITAFQKGNLRKVNPGEGVPGGSPPITPSGGGAGGMNLLQSLANALEMRRAHMRNRDSDADSNSPSDGGSDDDWET